MSSNEKFMDFFKKNQNVCILAYDALEIDLVERFNFANLKQREYGKTDISEFDAVFTPILWGSFITGENLEAKFLGKEKGSKFLKKVFRSPYKFIKKNISSEFAIFLKRYLKEWGVVHRVEGKVTRYNVSEDLGKKTIFNLVDSSLGINIPSFNKVRTCESSMEGKIEGRVSDSEFQEGVWDCFEETRKELMQNLDKDLVMAWFGPADWMGHVYRGDMEVMEDTYEVLNDLAGDIEKRFDGVVLIVSDHGMMRLGDYGDNSDTNYGFYSSNVELGLNYPKITEFYEIIKGVLSGNLDFEKYSHEDLEEQNIEEDFEGSEEEEIKRRLKDLGYFE